MTVHKIVLSLFASSVFATTVFAQSAKAPDASPRGENLRFYSTFKVGDTIPDTLEIYEASGERLPAKKLFRKPYTVIVSGCLTCGQFRTTYQQIEAIYADYKDQDVDFYYIFQTLQHPENHGYVQAFSMEERFLQVNEAKNYYKTQVPWILDTFDNNWKAYFQGHPNSEIIFDRNGRMVHVEPWVRRPKLRNALAKIFGPVDPPTRVADLNLPDIERRSNGPVTGVVERLKVPGNAIPLKFTPAPSEQTYYAKLRPEVDNALYKTGSGKMYLGLHLDPIYEVHWNNLADPVVYELTLPDGVTATPMTDRGPLPDVESDKDPREFLIDINNWSDRLAPIVVDIFYFACSKEHGWCKPVSQTYTVQLDRDPFGGSAYSRRNRPGGNRATPKPLK